MWPPRINLTSHGLNLTSSELDLTEMILFFRKLKKNLKISKFHFETDNSYNFFWANQQKA